jgi:glutaredoxin
MKKVTKNRIVMFVIILAIILISYFSLTKSTPETDKEIVQCIGEQATLYSQLGCPHCKTQEELFGDNIEYIEVIDCFYEKEKCKDIMATPTWVIKGKQYTGLKTITKLQELTGC